MRLAVRQGAGTRQMIAQEGLDAGVDLAEMKMMKEMICEEIGRNEKVIAWLTMEE